MSERKKDDVHQVVRERYASIVQKSESCCGSSSQTITDPEKIGYSNDVLTGLDDVAGTSLGCGNPLGLEAVRPGDVVLDLGSGTGLDCFLAANATGKAGQVIGVDMTPEMIETATRNALKHGIDNVEFRLGQIEALPVDDLSVDLVISNCVINLSPDKEQVFREVFRVLRPNGHLVFTDIVATAPIDSELRQDLDALAGCISGAAEIEDIRRMMEDAGFANIALQILDNEWGESQDCCTTRDRIPVASALIRATKMAG